LCRRKGVCFIARHFRFEPLGRKSFADLFNHDFGAGNVNVRVSQFPIQSGRSCHTPAAVRYEAVSSTHTSGQRWPPISFFPFCLYSFSNYFFFFIFCNFETVVHQRIWKG
jgi:hypothetical protein